VLDFIGSIVQQLEVGVNKTRIGVVQYSDTAVEVMRLNTYYNKQDVIYNIKKIPFIGGRTYTSAAIRKLVITANTFIIVFIVFNVPKIHCRLNLLKKLDKM